MDFKNFHLGKLLRKRTNELDISSRRLTNFLNCSEEELEKMYQAESLDTKLTLRWSKILDYDFFRLYSHHLILYSPEHSKVPGKSKKKDSSMPQFRKNIYSQELIDYILELIEKEKKTRLQVIDEYRIPKTTLYKWISKKTEFEK